MKKNLTETNYSINFDIALDKFNQKQYMNAIYLFELDLENPNNIDNIYYWIGRSYYELNMLNKALIAFNNAINFSKKEEFFYWRHKTHIKKGNLQEAIKDLKKTIEINPLKTTNYRFELNKLFSKEISNTKLNSRTNKVINISGKDNFYKSINLILKIFLTIITIPLLIVFIILLPYLTFIITPIAFVIIFIAIIYYIIWK